MSTSFLLSSPAELAQLAVYLRLKAGKHSPLILLDGPLGAGKTTFTKELYRIYGGDPSLVQSPTFNHIHEYPLVEGFFVHIDLYRGKTDLSELVSDRAARIILVEWANIIEIEVWRDIGRHYRPFLCKIDFKLYILPSQRLVNVEFKP